MATPLSTLRLAALATTIAFAGVFPAVAAPMFLPSTPAVPSDIIQVRDSAKIIHRGRLDNDGGGPWRKQKHFRQKRNDGRDFGGRDFGRRDFDGRNFGRRDFDRWDFDGRYDPYRPKATPKYAYDAYGNYRVYDDDGWDGDWHKRGRYWGSDWDNEKRRRPRIVKMNSFGYQEPSPALKEVLTAVPD